MSGLSSSVGSRQSVVLSHDERDDIDSNAGGSKKRKQSHSVHNTRSGSSVKRHQLLASSSSSLSLPPSLSLSSSSSGMQSSSEATHTKSSTSQKKKSKSKSQSKGHANEKHADANRLTLQEVEKKIQEAVTAAKEEIKRKLEMDLAEKLSDARSICLICREGLSQPTVSLPNCGHEFCRTCIVKYYSGRSTIPAIINKYGYRLHQHIEPVVSIKVVICPVCNVFQLDLIRPHEAKSPCTEIRLRAIVNSLQTPSLRDIQLRFNLDRGTCGSCDDPNEFTQVELAKHHRCPKSRSVPCCQPGCKALIECERSALINHFENECKYNWSARSRLYGLTSEVTFYERMTDRMLVQHSCFDQKCHMQREFELKSNSATDSDGFSRPQQDRTLASYCSTQLKYAFDQNVHAYKTHINYASDKEAIEYDEDQWIRAIICQPLHDDNIQLWAHTRLVTKDPQAAAALKTFEESIVVGKSANALVAHYKSLLISMFPTQSTSATQTRDRCYAELSKFLALWRSSINIVQFESMNEYYSSGMECKFLNKYIYNIVKRRRTYRKSLRKRLEIMGGGLTVPLDESNPIHQLWCNHLYLLSHKTAPTPDACVAEIKREYRGLLPAESDSAAGVVLVPETPERDEEDADASPSDGKDCRSLMFVSVCISCCVLSLPH